MAGRLPGLQPNQTAHSKLQSYWVVISGRCGAKQSHHRKGRIVAHATLGGDFPPTLQDCRRKQLEDDRREPIQRNRRQAQNRGPVTGGFSRGRHSPKLFGPACGLSAVLGRMPWVIRATAIEPDAAYMAHDTSKTNHIFVSVVARGDRARFMHSIQSQEAMFLETTDSGSSR